LTVGQARIFFAVKRGARGTPVAVLADMRTWFVAPAITGALLATAPEARACPGCSTTYGSFGPLVSFAFGDRSSFGVGAELSAEYWPDNRNIAGFGGYVNAVGYFTDAKYGRFNVGAQGNQLAFGGEAGFSYLSATTGRSDLPAAVGPTLGCFADALVLLLAIRTTVPFDGPPQVSLDLGLKLPFILQGEGYYLPSGRPLRLGGKQLVARADLREEHRPSPPCVRGLSREARDYMAQRWLSDARQEHASIYAFCMLARRLVLLGAPRFLVCSALQAATEELLHAQDCLCMASRYDGRVWDLPAPPAAMLPVANEVGDEDVRELVRETWIDGCIGEGLAAELARARGAVLSPERGRDVLVAISREERSHADLGFEVLRFLLTLEGSRGEVARDEIGQLLRHAHAPAFCHLRADPLWFFEDAAWPRLGAKLDETIARGLREERLVS
jgi:hypothetical protein